MSDASKTDAEIAAVRRENAASSGARDSRYTGPERLGQSRPGRQVADAAARRQRALIRSRVTRG